VRESALHDYLCTTLDGRASSLDQGSGYSYPIDLYDL
jgi:hypothetical protein